MLNNNEPLNSNILVVMAVVMDRFPEAIGLFLFIGWSLSVFLSKQSFSKYVEELIKQKAIKIYILLMIISVEKYFPDNMGINTSVFFVHWCILSDFIIFFSI